MSKKNSNQKQLIFKYFEDTQTIWEIVLFILHKEGWLQRKKFSDGDQNLLKIGTKTFNAIINQFKENDEISLTIVRPNIAEQYFGFKFEVYKKQTLLGTSTIINIENHKLQGELKKMIRGYVKNMKQLDNQIRDELERRGLKAYF